MKWLFFGMWPSKTRKRSIVLISRIEARGNRCIKSSLVASRQISRFSQLPDRVTYRGVPDLSRLQLSATKTIDRIDPFIPKGVLNNISWEPLIEIYIFTFLPTFHTNGTLLLKLADSELGNLHSSACNDRHKQSFRPWWDAKKKPQGF